MFATKFCKNTEHLISLKVFLIQAVSRLQPEKLIFWL